MRTLTLGATFALLVTAVAFVQGASRASAEVTWCLLDPTLVIDGKAVHLNVGVPKDQVKSVSEVTLVVTVPSNVRASLSGTQAANGIGRLGIKTELSPTAPAWHGAGAVPVRVTATVHTAPGAQRAGAPLPTVLSAWQSSVGDLGQTSGTAGRPMTLPLHVRRS